MANYCIVSEKKWHENFALQLNAQFNGEHTFTLIQNKADFTLEKLKAIQPKLVFIPHWSYKIENAILETFDCVIFHMTDLPYGRGGSPLQNLIVRGHTETKLSALKATEEFDAGPIYLKQHLSLLGTAEEIFIRAAELENQMIVKIIQENIEPQEQFGEPTIFKRRKPEDGNLEQLNSLKEIYDYIRMLDADSYPNAFIETEHFKFEFSRASLKSNESILADVRITKK